MSSISSSRGYVFTINNSKCSKEEVIELFKMNYPKTLLYVCISKECGEHGTLHLQGYIEFSSPIAFINFKNVIPTAHIEKRRGNPSQARDYVFKVGDYIESVDKITTIEAAIEFGALPDYSMGKRNDLSDIVDMLESGCLIKDIRIAYPSHYLRYRQHIHSLYQEIIGERYSCCTRELDVFYIYGSSRTGKTSGIYNYYGFESVYRCSNYDNPFDGYVGQDIVLLDDFNSNLKIEYMLQLLEGYPMMLKSRYNDKVACFTKIFIISNLDISCQYIDIQKSNYSLYQAFLNRFDLGFEVSKFGDLEDTLTNYDNNLKLLLTFKNECV